MTPLEIARVKVKAQYRQEQRIARGEVKIKPLNKVVKLKPENYLRLYRLALANVVFGKAEYDKNN
jgi:hypothetical protein